MPVGPTQNPRSAAVPAAVDRVGEVVQVGAYGVEESKNGGPPEVPFAALYAGEIRAIEAGVGGYLGLGEARTAAQLAESVAEEL